MASTLGTLFWYLRRPRLYPELWRAVAQKLSGSSSPLDNTREEATKWCAERALDTAAALRKLTGSAPARSITELYPEVFADAHRRADACPVRMGGPGDLDLIYYIAEHCSAMKAIETGVAYGWSSLAVLLSLTKRPGSKLISTDMPYPNLDNDQYVGCVVSPELAASWRILRYADRQGLPRALEELGTLDMCHYDSDKSYAGRMWAYPALWAAIRKGGFLLSDDISDNVAFRDFCTNSGLVPTIVKFADKFIGVIPKSS